MENMSPNMKMFPIINTMPCPFLDKKRVYDSDRLTNTDNKKSSRTKVQQIS